MALKKIYKIKLGPIPTKWRHHVDHPEPTNSSPRSSTSPILSTTPKGLIPQTITAPSTIKKRKQSPAPNFPVQKPSALDLPNEKKLHYGHMVQHQSSANPTTTPTSQFPDTMNYLATFTTPRHEDDDDDDVLPRLRTVPNPNPDSDPSSSSSSSSSSLSSNSSNSSLSDSSESTDESLRFILSDKERKKARKTNRRRLKRKKQRAYTKLFNKLCKAAHHHKLKALRLEGDPKSKQTATILWIETIKDVLRTRLGTNLIAIICKNKLQ